MSTLSRSAAVASEPVVEHRATAVVREWVEWLADFAREVQAVREQASQRLR